MHPEEEIIEENSIPGNFHPHNLKRPQIDWGNLIWKALAIFSLTGHKPMQPESRIREIYVRVWSSFYLLSKTISTIRGNSAEESHFSSFKELQKDLLALL